MNRFLQHQRIAMYRNFIKAAQETGYSAVTIIVEIKIRMLFLKLLQDQGKIVHLSAVAFQEGGDLLLQVFRFCLFLQLNTVGGSLLYNDELGALVLQQGNQLGVAVVSGIEFDEFVAEPASPLAQIGRLAFVFIVLYKSDN